MGMSNTIKSRSLLSARRLNDKRLEVYLLFSVSLEVKLLNKFYDTERDP